MTTISQSRPSAIKLVGLIVAASVGVVGCSAHPTTSASSSAGETSSSAVARQMVDVEAVWATHPMPDCPKPPIQRNGGAVPAGFELPTESTVSEILTGTKSPAPEEWVRVKLGWVMKWLLKVRGDIVDANTPGDNSMMNGFSDYVRHVRSELEAGQDISSSSLDGDYPEGCA